jgi:hypothetical protein
MASKQHEQGKREQQARERGEALPFYTKKVAKELSTKKKTGKVTPSKRD